jgi:hypothetical protein
MSAASTASRWIAQWLVRHAANVLRPIRPTWSEAMEHELDHIEDDHRALTWALGCVWAGYTERYLGGSHPKCAALLKWYLWIMIVLNAITACVLLCFGHNLLPIIRSSYPNLTELELRLAAVITLPNIAFAVALLRGKSWGLWGVLLISVAWALINAFVLDVPRSQLVLGLLNFPILTVLFYVGGQQRV